MSAKAHEEGGFTVGACPFSGLKVEEVLSEGRGQGQFINLDGWSLSYRVVYDHPGHLLESPRLGAHLPQAAVQCPSGQVTILCAIVAFATCMTDIFKHYRKNSMIFQAQTQRTFHE